jgi:hypothetical protein
MQPIPNELERQRVLDRYRIVDTLPEDAYDDIVRLAATICDVPVALVSLLDRDRQWFKSRLGLEESGTARDVAFCDHAIREPGRLMQVGDATRDPRFARNPMVTADDGVRFYAGMPLVTPEGAAIGTVCVVDRKPRALDARQQDALKSLARLTMRLLDARRGAHDHQVEATLAKAEAAETPTAGGERVVALFELQQVDAATRRLGERGLERALQAFEATLAARVDADDGDSVGRVTGSGELVAVLHGADAAATARALRAATTAFEREHGLHVLAATAEGRDDEPLHDAFMRAETALSDAKDADAAARRH